MARRARGFHRYQEYASKEEDGMVGSEGNSPRLAGRRAGKHSLTKMQILEFSGLSSPYPRRVSPWCSLECVLGG